MRTAMTLGETRPPRGRRLDRASDPVVKVEDLAWLEFVKPDLDAAERFAHDFGFVTTGRTDREMFLRGARAGTHCIAVRKGPQARFVGPAFKAATRSDVTRLAEAHGAAVRPLTTPGGGVGVELSDPVGMPVRVVADVEPLPELPRQQPLAWNVGDEVHRVNATQ
jgi:hypothetical protein